MEENSDMMGSPGMDGMDEYDMEDMDGMGDMDGYGHEMGDGEMDMMGEYDDEAGHDDDGDSLNFDNDPQFAHLPPLDKMRKVRREVIKTCNEYRQKFGHPSVYTDTLTNHAANEYAKFLLTDDQNDDSLAQIAEHHKVVGVQKAIVGFSYLDDDHDAGDLTKMNEFMDAHGLLLELQEEMGQITNKDYTHIGVGFAANK
jgi:hypothetical protein